MAQLVPPLTAYRKRQSPGVTQAALAQRLGVTTSHVSRIERFGTANLPMAMVLAKLTGLPVETFAPTGEARI